MLAAIKKGTSERGAQFQRRVRRNAFLLGCLAFSGALKEEHLIVGYGYWYGKTTGTEGNGFTMLSEKSGTFLFQPMFITKFAAITIPRQMQRSSYFTTIHASAMKMRGCTSSKPFWTIFQFHPPKIEEFYSSTVSAL
jgi:hypothetical protein